MDIGTAKPTLAEQASLKHHLIDVVGEGKVLHRVPDTSVSPLDENGHFGRAQLEASRKQVCHHGALSLAEAPIHLRRLYQKCGHG